jgi:hypothetical protein
LGGAEPLSIPYKLGVGMTASVKRKAAPVDLSAPAATALEAALADKPLSLRIMSERLIWPEVKDDEGENE